MQQILVQIFFTTRSWSFWKQHKKGTVETTTKIETYLYYIFTEKIFSPQYNASGSFLPTCITFVEQRLTNSDPLNSINSFFQSVFNCRFSIFKL